MNDKPLNAILGIFNKLTLQQKFVLGGAAVVTSLLLISLIFFLNEPNYTPLFSNLAQEDAAKVLENLNAQKIPYQIDDNGQTIKVPKEKLYETRMNLAAKGIPTSGSTGYELFDNSTMGMSEFMQKLNYKRALEGELSRTIMKQEGIEGVRVHIVFPQKTVFKDDEKLPTASVVLKLKGGFTLTKSNANAIVNLVSSAVEGLQPNKVTLIDTKGRVLSKENEDNSIAATSAKQYEMKQSIENYLADKAQSILDNVLGYGNAMVQVNADINFDRVEKTMELYDPESQVAISEQTVKTENTGRNYSDSSAQFSENSTTNYEISKTIQRVIEGSGNIKRLSVAAVINDVAKEVIKDEQPTMVYEPRTQEQMQKLEEIIRNAVGIVDERNDQFSIVNLSFETKQFDDMKPQSASFMDDPEKWLNMLLVVIAIASSILLLKGLMGKLKNEKIVIGTFGGGDFAYDTYEGTQEALPASSSGKPQQIAPKKKKQLLPIGDIEDEISDEAIRKKNQQEKITNYVSKNPMDAAKLINAWLHEDEN
ncbi:MAG TPA: flagellar basal-body MS-ring/collar protein FliF [Ignavibacteriaceae bacterium]|nr:flagellar basal-body MS-ring/collar protein FliF [Ignavibacteriaceae bacterium]